MATSHSRGVAIRGLFCAVPSRTVTGDEDGVFTEADVAAVQKVTGVHARRVVGPETCTSDLCRAAGQRLLDDLGWAPQSVEALILVTQTPDYIIPATACALQAQLGLSDEVAAFDVNLGCSGYVYGLWLASSLIASGAVRRVLLMVGDTVTKFSSPLDRGTALLFGDCGTATALEAEPAAPEGCYVWGTDGAGVGHLLVPGGGYRNPATPGSFTRVAGNDGVLRSALELCMDGGEVFNFTIERVVPLLRRTLEFSGLTAAQVDLFVFHQANEFIIRHLAKKLKVDVDKVPLTLDRFGNTSSASIPLTLAVECQEALRNGPTQVILAGFGVGYSWAAAALVLGPLQSIGWFEV